MIVAKKLFEETFYYTIVYKTRVAPLIASFILGVGFFQSSAINSAAHDARHSLIFSCH